MLHQQQIKHLKVAVVINGRGMAKNIALIIMVVMIIRLPSRPIGVKQEQKFSNIFKNIL